MSDATPAVLTSTPPETSHISKVSVGIATTVGAALIIAIAGGIANFLVMRSEVATLRTDLAAHTAREGHEATLRRMDRLDARLEAAGGRTEDRQNDINRRLSNLETGMRGIRDDQQELLRSLPASWRRGQPAERRR